MATNEGGAISGEKRLREHLDELYGALLSHEIRPATYPLERTDARERELADIERSLSALEEKDLKAVNDELKAGNMPPIVLPDAAPEEGAAGSNARPGEEEEEVVVGENMSWKLSTGLRPGQ